MKEAIGLGGLKTVTFTPQSPSDKPATKKPKTTAKKPTKPKAAKKTSMNAVTTPASGSSIKAS